MPRRKLSEYRAKTIIFEALGIQYTGHSITKEKNIFPSNSGRYVVKVDQAVKGRFKKGLVLLNVPKSRLKESINTLKSNGYESFLIEPYIKHAAKNERYLSLTNSRNGIFLSCSRNGGIDIESNVETIKTFTLGTKINWTKLALETGLPSSKLKALITAFRDSYFSFLEINPYVIDGETITILDAAVEVDDAGMHFTSQWSADDLREAGHLRVEQERVVKELNNGSAASFNLSVINPNGSIFLLLSGGGASVMIADEVHNKGLGNKLANYGEYSGNPNFHETRKYTHQVLELLLASKAPKKILFVGGAVANFTDIATTFAGVIAAIEAKAEQFTKQDITVYVRRGGPNQEKGLASIKDCLVKNGIYGGVYDPSTPIASALGVALEGM